MGGTPPCTLDPPLRGDCPPCPSRGDNEEQEFHLLGDTLPDTPTEMPGLGTDDQMVPWRECHVRELLNRLRAQEVTPHKLQLCWDTLRWFAKKFGLLAVQEEHRLLEKKQTVETGLTPPVQPARKAKVPPKEVIWALEEPAGKGGICSERTGYLHLGDCSLSGGLLSPIQ